MSLGGTSEADLFEARGDLPLLALVAVRDLDGHLLCLQLCLRQGGDGALAVRARAGPLPLSACAQGDGAHVGRPRLMDTSGGPPFGRRPSGPEPLRALGV